MGRPGLKKVVKTVRGKHGSVKRTYWVKANPKEASKRQGKGAKEPGFLRRNAGKLALGAAALAGTAYMARKHLSGSGHAKIWKGSVGNKANVWQGSVAHSGAKTPESPFQRARSALRDKMAPHGHRLTEYRRTVGADLAGHMTRVGGEAAAHHIGSKFGSVAGTAIGGAVSGPVGAGIGGFLGGHAGGFLANRHTEKHINRVANWAVNRMRR